MPIGTISNNEVGSSVRTKLNAALAQLDALSAIKMYRAIVTQAGVAAPTATVLENTLGGTVVWTRSGVGEYLATLTGAFTVNKTFIRAGLEAGGDVQVIDIVRNSADELGVSTWTGAGLTDGVMTAAMVEILVYP